LKEKVKQLALLQYFSMLESGNFSEAGKDRVRIDFARHLLQLPASYQVSTLDLDSLDKLIGEAEKPVEETKVILAELREKENVIIASRKEGFPIVIFGPQTIIEKDAHKIIIIEKELARTPTAILAIAAFTQQDGTIIVRREAFEHIFYRKWAKLDKEQIIKEMIEITITHEISHAVIAENNKNKNLYILGKMLDAYLSNNSLDALNEVLAEWEPTHGTLPYLAKIAQTDYPKAKRMLFRYLADANFKQNGDQAFMVNYAKLFFASIKPYVTNNREIDFAKILADAPVIFEQFQNKSEQLVQIAKEIMEGATFKLGGLSTDFETLASVQHKKFQEQNPAVDPNSDYYQRYFWSNLAKYLKTCAPDHFEKINNQLQTELESCYN